MEKRATIVDVAKAAGVSTATVSYILNKTGGHSFTDETVQRVYEAVRQLDYTRSPSARRPRESNQPQESDGQTKNVCVAYASISLRVQIILQGVMQVLHDAGYNILQTPIEVDIANQRIKALDQYFSDNVEGIICLGLAGWSMGETWSDIIVERRVPFICVDCQWDRNISSVEIDYLNGAYEVVAALIRGGVNKFYYIHDPNQPPQTQERLRGIRRAIFETGTNAELIAHSNPLNLNPFVTYSTDQMDYADSMERLAALLDGLDSNSAILLDWADHNQFALRICAERGLTIPIAALERGTLSPVAFPNLYYSALPLRDMGVAAANALLRQLKDPNDITHELLVPTLIRAE